MFLNKIKKRDGSIADFDPERIKNAVHRAFLAVELENGEKAESITEEVVALLKERFRTEIPSVENVQDTVVEVLKKKGYGAVAQAYEDYRRKKEELRALRETLGIEPKLTVNALEVLKARYLLRDEKENIIETPAQLFERVAKAIAKVDKTYGDDAETSARIFYEMMARLEFLPNSPTLFNAGTAIGQLSACFVLPVPDSLEGIFTAVKNMALIEQTGGGVGFNFSQLRPKGDIVRSTKGVASGPISFMRIFDVATEVIKAGGKRRGAMMGILRVDHPDILEFITAKQNPTFLSNFNVSVAVTDEFMQAVAADEAYWLINPRNREKVRQLKARDVWNLIARSAWASGDPGVVFIDEINRHNPTPQVGLIESTNPCVTSDTWVMTEEGPRKVKELIGKEFVAVVKGEKWRSSKEGFFLTGTKLVYQLKTKEGFELKLTLNHPLLRVKKLTRNAITTEWASVADIKVGDKIVLNDHRSFAGWVGEYNEGEGYLMGLLLGDGAMKKDKAVLSSWGEDEGSKSVRALAYAYAKALPHKSDFQGWMKVSDRSEYRMALGYIRKIAQKLGVTPDSKDITESMEKASSAFCKGLLRGLFDADGSVQGSQLKGVSIRLAQSNLSTLKAVQRILLRFGVFSTIYVNRRCMGPSWMPNGKGGTKEYIHKPQHELVISKENILVFCEKIGFGDSNKQQKLERCLKSYKRRLNREHFVAAVSEIMPVDSEEVYDAMIPGINAFDANGFYVHNCGEQPLLPYESCNLGSINLSRIVTEGKVNWDKLRETVRNAVHFLDNVVDANVYPLKEIAEVTRANRKIGLGVMGFADMLIMLGVPYDSEEALKLAERVMQFIQKEAHEKSREIGEARGSFPNFEQSIWKGKYSAFRNATVTTVAPTGTISIIAGCSSGIEPLFAVSFIRNVLGGARLFETNVLFEAVAKERGFYSAKLLEEVAKTGSVQKIVGVPDDVKRVFVTALDIAPVWHVRMQAAFQKFTDNAVSKTVNMPFEAKVEDVREIFDLAWQLKCKGITVFRYGSKPEQVLYIGEVKTKEGKFVSAQSEYAGGCPTPNCPFPS
ncbi:MAG: ATP cone domain-containing protein [Candidatus Bathyarchaeota archaeon]|nr:ATP cone domain-containing protein [Candidatus Bathyarchaeota archaeon]